MIEPKVSVCLMTFNGAATVRRALSTLLAQTYRDYELIISDDHSTDGTLAICEHLAQGHTNVRFVRPERNLGAYDNMRFALLRARGRYFLWACQDDYWEAGYLSQMVEAIERKPGAVCAQGKVRWIIDDGRRSEILRLEGRDRPECQTQISLASSLVVARSRDKNSKNEKVLKNNVFMHGLWNLEVYKNALAAHGKPFSNERQILGQAALMGRFCYVDELLMHKYRHSVKLQQRYPSTDAILLAKSSSSQWREVRELTSAIFRSSHVKAHLKIAGIPAIWFGFIRHRLKQRKFLLELPSILRKKALSTVSGGR